ncbi:hypothetical protein IWX78_000226 [Mycetocola sp. CAN_C7]|uniref:hypothetical protein n=1 Tax=Mycetocola sp. CAN_C7 TaxID=2787724 RepID=UPI0018C95F3F
MSNPGSPQNPYGQPTQGAPAGYQPQKPSATADRSVVRQIIFGGAVVIGIAVVTNILGLIGNSVFGFRVEQILGMIWAIFVALVFVAGAGLSALYIAPFAKASSVSDLIKRLAIAAGVGAAALLVLNFIWSVINGGQYLAQLIISSGIVGSISTGVAYGAFFALGVFVARALPAGQRSQPAAPQQGNAGQSYQGQPYQGQPQGSAAQPQQGQPAQVYAPPAPGYVAPQVPAPGQGQPPVPPQPTVPPQG